MFRKLLVLCCLGPSCAVAADVPVAPPLQVVAPDVSLLPGAILDDRGPDGNTVLFNAPDGLVVVDTGRHAWHSDAILAVAHATSKRIVAIVNTHWHLDHTSGNRRLKAMFPDARVYGTNAVDGALQPGGFLMREFAKMPGYLTDPGLSDTQRDEVRLAMDTMEHRDSLRPDVIVSTSGLMTLAGRSIDVHVTDGAVTDADLWLFDTTTKVAVLGDLVTFPAPFFETACPGKWRKALAEVSLIPFVTAIPGHGAPMDHNSFETYRSAYNGFIDCVSSKATAQACAAGWTNGISHFLPDDAARKTATQYAAYYSGFLRANKGKAPDCKTE